MREHPEDCAIEIAYEGTAAQMFRFTRLPSNGVFYEAIVLDTDGNLTIGLPKESAGKRFLISFVLPDHYSSGGFAGIKVWPEGHEKPAEYQDSTGLIPGTPFHLHVHHEGDSSRVRKLSLSDVVEAPGRFLYNLGLDTDDLFIESHDPQIYNTGPVGGEG